MLGTVAIVCLLWLILDEMFTPPVKPRRVRLRLK